MSEFRYQICENDSSADCELLYKQILSSSEIIQQTVVAISCKLLLITSFANIPQENTPPISHSSVAILCTVSPHEIVCNIFGRFSPHTNCSTMSFV